MKIKWDGVDKLSKKLLEKSETDFLAVSNKNIRDIYSRSQKAGGTPVDSAELRIITKRNNGYTFREITLEDSVKYEQKMFYYNIMIRNDEFEKDIANYILNNLNNNIKDNLELKFPNPIDSIKVK